MRIREVSWRRYRLPFVAPFRTAHGETTHRDGLILRLLDADGLSGLGEAAPLAEFNGGDVLQAETTLSRIASDLIGCDAAEAERLLQKRLAYRPDTAALRCALDTALLDLTSRREEIRLFQFLAPAAFGAVRVNATIGQPETDRAVTAAREAVARGFQTIKLKVGVRGAIEAEVRRVAAVREAIGPGIELRLDANGAWTPDLAVQMVTALAGFDIELIEQPVAAYDLAGLAEVRRSAMVQVAADEAVTGLESARRVIAADAADALVLKPMVCGGLRVARQIIDVASDAGLRVIVSSAIEGGVGVAAALHLALTLPAGSPACGLATGDLLADDLIVEPLDLVNGEMRAPAAPGLGVALDEENLDAFAGAPWQHSV